MISWSVLLSCWLASTAVRPVVVVLPPGAGDVVREYVAVTLPLKTAHAWGSAEERRCLLGYAEGQADTLRMHLICRSNAGDRDTREWRAGWSDGSQAAKARGKRNP